MGILDPFSSGFVKVPVYNILCKNIPKFQGESKTTYTQRLLNKQFSMYNDFFATKTDTRFKVKYKTFVNNCTKIKDNINTLNKRHQAKRKEILKTFTEESWKNSESKRQHSLTNCKICCEDTKLKRTLSKFPVKNQIKKR